jgi:hypothetical protein
MRGFGWLNDMCTEAEKPTGNGSPKGDTTILLCILAMRFLIGTLCFSRTA